jgi:aminopeptidase N
VVAPLVGVTGSLPPSGVRSQPLPVNVWAVDRGSATPLASLASSLATAIAALQYYEAVFNVSYALPKADLVYLPVFPVGAMEQVR